MASNNFLLEDQQKHELFWAAAGAAYLQAMA